MTHNLAILYYISVLSTSTHISPGIPKIAAEVVQLAASVELCSPIDAHRLTDELLSIGRQRNTLSATNSRQFTDTPIISHEKDAVI